MTQEPDVHRDLLPLRMLHTPALTLSGLAVRCSEPPCRWRYSDLSPRLTLNTDGPRQTGGRFILQITDDGVALDAATTPAASA